MQGTTQSQRHPKMQEKNDTDYEEALETLLRRVDVPVKALLGQTAISVNDFINLQCGDIIRLDSKVEENLSIYVGNIKKFTALPGTEKNHYAMQVTTVLREGE